MTGIITFIASLFIRMLHATLRVRHVRVRNLEALPQYILAFSHGHLLMMIKSRFRRPISVLISQSKDGELIAGTIGHFGVQSVRGSSTRGGMGAMRELLRVSRSGANIVFTPDGPKGPYHVASDSRKHGSMSRTRSMSSPTKQRRISNSYGTRRQKG